MEASESNWIWFMPELVTRFPRIFGWDKVISVGVPIKKFFKAIVNDHIETMDSGLTDFAYSYLEEVNNTPDPTSSFYKEIGRKLYRNITIYLKTCK